MARKRARGVRDNSPLFVLAGIPEGNENEDSDEEHEDLNVEMQFPVERQPALEFHVIPGGACVYCRGYFLFHTGWVGYGFFHDQRKWGMWYNVWSLTDDAWVQWESLFLPSGCFLLDQDESAVHDRYSESHLTPKRFFLCVFLCSA